MCSAYYVNQFAVHIKGGSVTKANNLAKEFGFINHGQVSIFNFFGTDAVLKVVLRFYYISSPADVYILTGTQCTVVSRCMDEQL